MRTKGVVLIAVLLLTITGCSDASEESIPSQETEIDLTQSTRLLEQEIDDLSGLISNLEQDLTQSTRLLEQEIDDLSGLISNLEEDLMELKGEFSFVTDQSVGVFTLYRDEFDDLYEELGCSFGSNYGFGTYDRDVGSSALDCTSMQFLYQVIDELGYECGLFSCRW
ncbi:hypothetical protein N8342_10115 [Acidimicrobiales bacterium]|nr:hypothetical protein [Acidimicrobiales bacterium]